MNRSEGCITNRADSMARDCYIVRTASTIRMMGCGCQKLRIAGAERAVHESGCRVWSHVGPACRRILLARMLSAVTLGKRIVPGRLRNALPLFLLLAAWAVIGIGRCLSQAAELAGDR